jgi:hypothetical protein
VGGWQLLDFPKKKKKGKAAGPIKEMSWQLPWAAVVPMDKLADVSR